MPADLFASPLDRARAAYLAHIADGHPACAECRRLSEELVALINEDLPWSYDDGR